MINSKPSELLDHDHLVDVNNYIYVVVGNMHPPNEAIAYLKYIPTNRKTIWCNKNGCYERVVKKYGVKNVINSIQRYQDYSYDPVFGVSVPKVKLSKVRRVLRPSKRLRSILGSAKDKLEIAVVDIVMDLELNFGIPLSSIGINGSILADIHNVKYSDIDLVIYGCKESMVVAENIDKVRLRTLTKIPNKILAKHIASLSKIYGVPESLILKIHPPFRRLWYHRLGKEVNIVFVNNLTQRYGDIVYRPITPIELVLELNSSSCTSLYYPSISDVLEVKEVLNAGKHINVNEVRELLKHVISYEGIYSYIMYKGGKVKVKGVLEQVIPTGTYVVIIGASESPGYIKPL